MRSFAALSLYVFLTGSLTYCFADNVPETNAETLRQKADKQDVDIRRYLKSGDYNAAERVLREAIVLRQDDVGFASGLRIALGDLLREEGKQKQAGTVFQSVLNKGGIGWRQEVSARMGLAGSQGQSGLTESSVAGWNRALSVAREKGDTVLESSALRGLAITWLEAGQPGYAEPLLKRSLKMLEAESAPEPWQLAATLTVIGECYRARNKLALAEDAWTRALELDRKAFGESHPQVALVMGHLADVYSARKEFTLARDYANRVVVMMKSSCGEDSLATAAAIANLAGVEWRSNSVDAALESYGNALRIARNYPENSIVTSRIALGYALALKAKHRDKEAKALVLEANSFRQQTGK
jgi:tetratricopeptide (TPR) repeat protein